MPIVCAAVERVASVIKETIDNRRIHERVRCSAQIDVSWADRDGRSRIAKAQLVDVSAGGLSFLLNEKIDVNTPIQIHYSNSQFGGETRYWTCDIPGWVVGVQLDERVDWDLMSFESPAPAASDWPVGRFRPRSRFSNLVRNFFFGLGWAARQPY